MNTNQLMQKYCRTLAALAFLLPALSQAADEGTCKYLPAGKLELAFSEQSPQPTVDSSINGVPARAMIGTASYTTFLMRSTVERLGLKVRATGRYSMGIGGAERTYRTWLRDFSLGASHTGETEMLVIGDSAARGGPDAVVGADLLLRTDMELSLAGKYLRFFGPSGDCTNTHLAYWDRDAMAVPFTGKESNSNKPLFMVMVNGVELTAQIDTSAAHSVLTRHGAERAGIRFDAPGIRHGDKVKGFGDEALETRLATFDTFTIGDETIKHADLMIVDDSPQGRSTVDMQLGLDFLRAHRILFAMRQKRLYVSYLGGSVFAPHAQQTKDTP
jgi:predicted aspartyl protease